MFILRYSKASAYVRKILLVAHHLGLRDNVTLEDPDTSDPADTLSAQNPIGRIAILIKQDGSLLYDCRVNLDFLERQSDKFLCPETGSFRDLALTKAALAEGIIDSTILWVYADRFSGRQPVPKLWRSHHLQKIKRGCDNLEQNIYRWIPNQRYVGSSITLAACLSYFSFRNVYNQSKNRPQLLNCYKKEATTLSSFSSTMPNAN